ncbi:MAG: NDP-hexose 2,3-dehydratase family protein [Coprobacillus sp.]
MKDIKQILEWIENLNKETVVSINRTLLKKNSFWFYDKATGTLHNQSHSFFSIAGIKGRINNQDIEQPILLQDEIGYLGILCKEFNNELYYLMQAKIEPGNANCVQISPTIQATKSNFTQKHGGAKPAYLDYFINAKSHTIIADQIQSEQSSRFYGKRNRNMIILVEEEVEVVEKRFCWMTLTQIKQLMRYKNLVNMDTRTVLSCLPYTDNSILLHITDKEFYKSMHSKNYQKEIVEVYHDINNYKMFSEDFLEIVKLDELKDWELSKNGVKCKHEYPYEVIYCDIEIEGREVRQWTQPLFKANGIAVFGLIYTVIEGEVKFLVKIQPEIGCFDKIEIGPSIQKESNNYDKNDIIEELFDKNLKLKKGIKFDTILSEEGGRFYHEENRNIIMKVEDSELRRLPRSYHLVSYATLSHLNLFNNCLNIQLRNLISVLEV